MSAGGVVSVVSTRTMTTSAAVGLALGIAWGVAARVWMRLITTDAPEFTWPGTLLIVGFAAVAGLGMGLVRGASVSGRRRWWRICAVMALLLAMAPQGIFAFLPAFVLGGLALSGRLPAWVRALLGLATAAGPLVFALAVMTPAERVDSLRPVVIVGLYLLMAGQALAGSLLFRRWPHQSQPPAGKASTADAPAGEPSLV
jgi:hypothetical protein